MNTNPDLEPHQDYRSVLENELTAGQTDDGWTMVQPKSTKESKSVVTRLAKLVMATMGLPKQAPDPFTESGKIIKQGKTYATAVMTNDHERDQNGRARDYNCWRSRSTIQKCKRLESNG